MDIGTNNLGKFLVVCHSVVAIPAYIVVVFAMLNAFKSENECLWTPTVAQIESNPGESICNVMSIALTRTMS